MTNIITLFAAPSDVTMTTRATRQAMHNARKRVFRKARRQRIAAKEAFLFGAL